LQVNHHDTGVEVAGPSAREGEGERRVGPEGGSEVGAKVGVAVLGCGEDGVVVVNSEWRCGEFGDVVDEDEVRVEVDNFADAGGEEVGEVVAGVVEGAIESGADGGGDEARNLEVVEGVDLEIEIGEGVGEGAVEEEGGGGSGGGGDEVEDDVFWTGGVLEDGEDGGHGPPEVGDVECHCHVDSLVRTRVGGFRENGGTGGGVVEFGCLFEVLLMMSSDGSGISGNEKDETETYECRGIGCMSRRHHLSDD